MGTQTKSARIIGVTQTLESIMSGSMTGGRRHTVGGLRLNSLGIESVLYDSSRSSEYFAGEAARLLGEATTLEFAGKVMMDNINRSIRQATEIKTKFAVEGLDPLKFALEAETGVGAGGAKRAAFWGRVWETIKAFFHRIVLAVANFVKAVQVWISGPIAKVQSDFYGRNKDAILRGLSGDAGNQTMTVMPKSKIDIASAILEEVSGVKLFNDRVSGAEKALAMALDKVHPAEAIATAGGNKQFQKIVEEFGATTKGGSKKLLPGRSYVNLKIYGTENPVAETVTIKDAFSAVDFNMLSYTGFTTVKNLIAVGRQILAQSSKTFKLVNQAERKIMADAKSLADANGEEPTEGMTSEDMRALTAQAHELQKFRGIGVNKLFALFTVYMHQRGYLFTAAKLLLKGAATKTA